MNLSRSATLILSLLLCAAYRGTALAEEDKKAPAPAAAPEAPKPVPAKEEPAKPATEKVSPGKEAPAKPPAEPAKPPAEPAKPPSEPAKPDPTFDAAVKTLRDYVTETAEETDGLFSIDDPIEEILWTAKLQDISTKESRKVSEGKYIVRAAFVQKAAPELGRRDANLVVDFTVEKEGASWVVSDELLFSVDAKVRYTYSPEHKPIPVPGLTEVDSEPEGEGAMEGDLGEGEPSDEVERQFETY